MDCESFELCLKGPHKLSGSDRSGAESIFISVSFSDLCSNRHHQVFAGFVPLLKIVPPIEQLFAEACQRGSGTQTQLK